jgi:cytochrome b6-f complex iron-sulfur subunit
LLIFLPQRSRQFLLLIDKLLATAQGSIPVLTQGLEVSGGNPTYIVVGDQKEIARYGINAICTHMGCVVPWDAGANKFICPCHASQYDAQGGLLRGPAPLPLALVKAEVQDNKVIFSPWTEDDFRCTTMSCNESRGRGLPLPFGAVRHIYFTCRKMRALIGIPMI